MSMSRNALRAVARMLPRSVRERVQRGLAALDTPREALRSGALTMRGSLENMRDNGFRPGAIIDVGAHVGEWSRMARAVFPGVPILMVEASADKDAVLAQAARALDPARHVIALLAGRSEARVVFHMVVTPQGAGTGCSVLREKTGFPTVPVELATFTLDELVDRHALPAPYLLKLDVQGYELEVLRGAVATLPRTEAVLAEVSLLEYNEGAPLAAEVIAHLAGEGLELYDVCSQRRRESDRALFQMDVIAVRRESPLRAPARFWRDQPAEV